MLKFCGVINCIFVHSPKKLTLALPRTSNLLFVQTESILQSETIVEKTGQGKVARQIKIQTKCQAGKAARRQRRQEKTKFKPKLNDLSTLRSYYRLQSVPAAADTNYFFRIEGFYIKRLKKFIFHAFCRSHLYSKNVLRD